MSSYTDIVPQTKNPAQDRILVAVDYFCIPWNFKRPAGAYIYWLLLPYSRLFPD